MHLLIDANPSHRVLPSLIAARISGVVAGLVGMDGLVARLAARCCSSSSARIRMSLTGVVVRYATQLVVVIWSLRAGEQDRQC